MSADSDFPLAGWNRSVTWSKRAKPGNPDVWRVEVHAIEMAGSWDWSVSAHLWYPIERIPPGVLPEGGEGVDECEVAWFFRDENNSPLDGIPTAVSTFAELLRKPLTPKP